MRFGVVILPESPWTEAARRWRRAEELGFDHAWTYDHLTWRTFRDLPWYGAVPTLAAAATVTERIRLGTLVASPNFRHPLTFSKDLITLDDISQGRIVAGIGSGASGWDATMLGNEAWTAEERSARFAEFVDLTDLLLREPRVTWRGKYYAVDEARTHPGCVQKPRLPLAVAATGRRAMRSAARHGEYWVTTGDPAQSGLPAGPGSVLVAKQLAALEEACAEIGRDARTLARIVLTGAQLDPGLSSVESFRETAGRYEEVGVTDLVVHWPRSSEPYAASRDVFEQVLQI